MTVTLRPTTRPRIASRALMERPMRNKVLKIACARCARIEYVDETPETAEPVCFHAALKGGGAQALEISFDELCAQCAKTVRGLLESIAKKIEGASPARKKGKTKPPPEGASPVLGDVVQVAPAPSTSAAQPPKGRLFGTIKTGS